MKYRAVETDDNDRELRIAYAELARYAVKIVSSGTNVNRFDLS